jgi:hypothetical protein
MHPTSGRLLPWLSLLWLLSGCAASFDETTLVQVRHPSAVRVGVQTPSSSERLLEAEGPPREVEIPATKPPFTELIRYAVAARRGSGGVTLTCPSCGGASERAVVVPDSPIELRGSPSETLVWGRGDLEMRFRSDGLFTCRKGRGLCPREALSLWLGTPTNNVVEIRYRKVVSTAHGERIGAWIGTFVGSALALGGASLAVGFSVDQGRASEGPLLLGGWFFAGGVFFLATGLRGLLAKDSETTVYRAE